VLKNFNCPDNNGIVTFILLNNLNTFGNESILNHGTLSFHVSIEVVVDLDQELDGLGDHSRILAVQGDVPHDLELVQLLRGLDKLEGRQLGLGFSLLLRGEGLDRAITPINVKSIATIAAIAIVAIACGGSLFDCCLRLTLDELLWVLVYWQEVLLEEVEADDEKVLNVKRAVIHLFREKFSDFIEIKNLRNSGRLLARALAPGEKLILIRWYSWFRH
jgi:hypothetical protein